ncbi:MAG: ABC transporter ATP-binding protein [Bacillota bacterium]|nr:ABC transporter ATP-binding protein [Bacillota bacterium]
MAKEKIKTWTHIKLLFTTIVSTNKAYLPSLIIFSLAFAAKDLINVFVPLIFLRALRGTWTLVYFGKILGLLILSKIFLAYLVNRLRIALKIQEEGLRVSFPKKIAQKAMAIDYASLEQGRVLDLKERASFAVTGFNAQANLLVALSSILSISFSLLGSGAIILAFSPGLLVLATALSLIIIYLKYKMSAYTEKMTQDLIPINRKYGYYSSLMFNPSYQKEIRLFNMADLIVAEADAYIDQVFDNMETMYKKKAETISISTGLQVLIRLVAYLYALARVLVDSYGPKISLEQFTVLVGGVESFIKAFEQIFAYGFEIKMALFHLRPFTEFMVLEEVETRQEGLDLEDFKSLVFDHVSFTYPNSDRKILDDLSFEIKKGQKISIVGINNAGKTTLVKLICGFFSPDSGRILLNGREISSYKRKDYLESLACVFQDFTIFPLSIEENVSPQGQVEPQRLDQIFKDLGLAEKISSLDQGYQSKFDKSIYKDAIDFSGGQKQKIAIARALYRQGSLVILDEPTAALDPLAEAEIYQNFNQLTKDKTTIFISHRMSSSKFCDKVLVLDGGKVVAFDSHKNLIQGSTIYKDLYQAQAQYFQV